MIRSFLRFLNQPFPEEDDYKTYLLKISGISAFVSLFIILIKPFGLHQLNSKVLIYAIGFGLITFISSIIFDLIVQRLLGVKYSGNSFTLWKWLLTTFCLILFISISNYAFISWSIPNTNLSIWSMLYATMIIGMFPIIFIGSITVISSSNRNKGIAVKYNERVIQGNPIILNDQHLFAIPMRNIYYVEAKQNYVHIHYLEHDEMKIKIQRATLTSIVKEVNSSSMIKCHRSFLVNVDKIIQMTGNAQGLKLRLQDLDTVIPVSRKYIDLFK